MQANEYPKIELFVGGEWGGTKSREARQLIKPAPDKKAGRLSCATNDGLFNAAPSPTFQGR